MEWDKKRMPRRCTRVFLRYIESLYSSHCGKIKCQLVGTPSIIRAFSSAKHAFVSLTVDPHICQCTDGMHCIGHCSGLFSAQREFVAILRLAFRNLI